MTTTAARKVSTPHPARLALSRALAMLGLVTGLASGCSSSDGPTIREAPPQVGAIGVNIFPGSITIAPGDSSGAGITISRGGQFFDAVTLNATGAPAGVALSLRPATVTFGMSSSVYAAVAAGTPPGTFEITIIGRSGTIVSLPATLTLRIR